LVHRAEKGDYPLSPLILVAAAFYAVDRPKTPRFAKFYPYSPANEMSIRRHAITIVQPSISVVTWPVSSGSYDFLFKPIPQAYLERDRRLNPSIFGVFKGRTLMYWGYGNWAELESGAGAARKGNICNRRRVPIGWSEMRFSRAESDAGMMCYFQVFRQKANRNMLGLAFVILVTLYR
jgi:hypothetical protein